MKQMSGCPLLDWLVNHGTLREQLAYRWLEENFGEIPDSIGGETLETIPSEIYDEVELILMKAAGGVQ